MHKEEEKMKHTIKTLALAGLSIAICSAPAFADRVAPAQNQKNCEMVETANVGVNFNNIAVDLKDTKSFMEQKSEEVLAAAADLEIENLHVQNMNYSVYSNNGGGCMASNAQYQMNGSMSFQLKDSQKAAELMEKLGELGYIVNFNMNAYRQCR